MIDSPAYNTYFIGQSIVKGIKIKSSFWTRPRSNDIKLYISLTIDPLNKTELNVGVVEDNGFYWTNPFTLDEVGEYIIHWYSMSYGIDYKQTFTVIPYSDLNTALEELENKLQTSQDSITQILISLGENIEATKQEIQLDNNIGKIVF